MGFDEVAVSARIECALVEEWEFGDAMARDVGFHMTDWLDDLGEWVRFCNAPGDFSTDEVTSLLTRFLAHAPSHLVAAHKLVMESPVTDVFGIGALDEDADG